MFDTYRAVASLKEVGLEEEVAVAVVNAIADAMTGNLATKADLVQLEAALKTDLVQLEAALKTDIAEVRAELKTDIAEVRVELKTDIAELRVELKTDISQLEASMFKNMLFGAIAIITSVVGINTGITFALLKLVG